ncbi:MAG: calcium-translocating P-type ATPase, PMCA-type [Bacteroides sp.]|nr:calcium-translocating P-type ATPase, PMCA-type [Bacteroides sp.]
MENSHQGLNHSQIEESRRINGANILTPPPAEPLWHKFLAKFNDPLIIILMIAGVLSIVISIFEYYSGEAGMEAFAEPVGIFIAIFLATGLAFYFEEKAGREFNLLNQVNDDEPVQVIRNGNVTQVPKKDIVVGDIVILNTGDDIPADGILLEAVSLTVDESTLTGEPSCAKTTDPKHFDSEATFASNAVMRGTRVIEGHGIMEVKAVGDHTENGKVFTATQVDNSVKTPLNRQLERLGAMISKVSYSLAVIVILGRTGMFLASSGFEWLPFLSVLLKSVMIAVALIVVSVPEGLPMAVTLSLAMSMRRMLKSNNLVRKLHACETMGATTVICTDKTGTLTENRMRVFKTDFFIPESDSDLIYEGMAVNSTAELEVKNGESKILGNPTEGALLLWLASKGIDYQTLRAENRAITELPFSTERKYMATLVSRPDGSEVLFVKGAPEIIFSLCCNFPGGVTHDSIDALLLEYQNRAMRTLGFAYQIVKPSDKTIADKRVVAENLTFIGVCAISDPVRADVPDAVKEVIDAGIRIKIVTGDTPATAREIGRQIGLWDDSADGPENIITGEEFALIPDEELPERVNNLKIIARARPMDKKRLVEALQHRGEIVAVTGDGTNDAPALKAAHVGLSMGDGTSVAKEASDITIIDNSFTSIGRAVMWGRSLYLNIQRFILFQMTVNVVACLIVLCGAFMGVQSPLTVTQMLWVNLIMDTFAAMALASLPPSEKVMTEKPRSRRAFIITPAMWTNILSVGLLFFLALFALLIYFEHTDVTSLREMFRVPFVAFHGLDTYELSLFFTIFVFLQFWNMFNARAFASHGSALNLKGCGEFILIAALIIVGQILIINVGGAFFSVEPISLSDWAIIICSTSSVLWIGEIYRLLRK